MMENSTESEEGGEFWLSIADMMSGLMVVFLFIAISYMIDVARQRDQTRQAAVLWNETHGMIYEDLRSEFAEDLPKWHASLDSVTLSVRFMEPEVFFTVGSAFVKPEFRRILDDFFPRYLRTIRGRADVVEEIRIEGHTSSEGPTENPYFYNMRLSQERTRAVLEYCLSLPILDSTSRQWAQDKLTANGLSSSRLVLRNGEEDRIGSRRVEFRVRTNAEQRLVEIIEVSR